MKTVPVVVLILGCVLFSCANAQADEQILSLPEDGWWIRYLRVEKQTVFGEDRESIEKLTYSIVGTVTEDGEKCRWIELRTVASPRGMERVNISKFLVSEKDLLEAERPLDKLKRAWSKSETRGLREVKLGQGIAADAQILNIFPGVWQQSKRLDKERIVDYQKGRLPISQALIQTVKTPMKITRPRPGQNTDRTTVVESTVWFDRATSPVFSAATLQFKSFENGELKASKQVDYTIEDIGTDANSQLPENN
jgi:hypothetical protein